MLCLRPARFDAAVGATNYASSSSGIYLPLRSYNSHSTCGTDGSAQSNKETAGQHLARRPSQRHIDRRWDQCRGLVFQPSRRAFVNDCSRASRGSIATWECTQPRTYATRPNGVGGSPPSPPPAAAKGFPTFVGPQNKDIVSKIVYEKKIKELSHEKEAWQRREKEYIKHWDRVKELEASLAGLAAKADADREDAYSRGKARGLSQMKAYEEKLEAKKALTKLAEDKARSLRGEIKRMGLQHARKLEEERREVEMAKRILDRRAKELQDWHNKERLQEVQGRDIRSAERKDYGRYQGMFDIVVEDRQALGDALDILARSLSKGRDQAKKSQQALREFCIGQPGVAAFKDALQHMASRHVQQFTSAYERLRATRDNMIKVGRAFADAGHTTRACTRVLRPAGPTHRPDLIGLMYVMLFTEPLKEMRRAIDEERFELTRRSKLSDSATVRQELEQEMQAYNAKGHVLTRLIRLTSALRTLAELEEVKRAPFVAKATFMSTLELEERTSQINRAYRFYVEDNALYGNGWMVRESFRHTMKALEDSRQASHNYARSLTAEQSRVLEADVDRALNERIDQANTVIDWAIQQLSRRPARGPTAFRGSPTAAPASPSRVRGFTRVKPAAIVSRRTSSLPDANSCLSEIRIRLAQAGLSREEERELKSPHDLTKLQALQDNASDIQAKLNKVPASRQSTLLFALKDVERIMQKMRGRHAGGESSTVEQTTPLATETSPAAGERVANYTGRNRQGLIRRTSQKSPQRFTSESSPRAHWLYSRRAYSSLATRRNVDKVNTQVVSTVTTCSTPLMQGSSHCTHEIPYSDADDVMDFPSQKSPAMSASHSGHGSDSLSGGSDDTHSDFDDLNVSAVREYSDSDVFSDESQASDSASSDGEDVELTYKISPEDYRAAAMASPSSSASFWTHRLYKNGDGVPPTVHYCKTFEQTETQLAKFADHKVLGFDLEWEMYAKIGVSPVKRCVSLVQIAAEDRIGLFHIALFKGESPELLIPPALRQILEDPRIAKTGVNISGDATRMKKCFNIDMQGVFELSHLYKVVKFSESAPQSVNRGLVSLQNQVEKILLLQLRKDDVRTSAWSKSLNEQQCAYAASDAYAGLQLYHALEAKRKVMSPRPPRPAFFELKQPLVLGDGTVIPLRTWTKRTASVQAPALDDEHTGEEDYVDAVEDHHEYELAPEHAEVIYPDLPSLEDLSIGDSATTATTAEDALPGAARSTTMQSRKSTSTSQSAEYTLAQSWVVAHRASLSPDPVPSLTNHVICVWQMWHHQELSVQNIAALLRVPPLASTTVASYIAQAVGKGRMEYDRVRMREVLEMIPEAGRWRYARIVKEMAIET